MKIFSLKQTAFKIFFTFFVFTALISCKDVNYQTQTVPGKFQITLPDFIVQTSKSELRYDLYAEDTLGNCIVMVLGERKDSMKLYGLNYSLLDYFHKAENSLVKQLHEGKTANVIEKPLGKYKSVFGKIVGKSKDVDLVYYFTVVETSKAFYQLYGVCPAEQNDRYQNYIQEAISSFKEL
jgi:hypothetical protein